ncbi:uncharacterized protein Z519_05767 [Cladophialophora bantiana CBS 173.52]|uniref:Uncharacterized protein n=1 Tax=Cladophialophora bantiana (strain ATCC 10958 / CBS 173.52 / CDC B-1940 / NIH 8579) TaxID=1442370 RepID=A0A0D2G392_CLAB1|nr:uncharacterized protein Z519_05767 [Cladophialophora bantiana CBS 173.52]KIW93162.1 hypothetical protein Z519_05767 [Cladophialophora bantiana CBS 173.52]
MGGGQRFHLPSLKRTKPNAPQQGWQPEGNEHKVQHLLGITETDLNTARNQSISSSATAKLPALSFSDATTELGSSHPPTEQLDAGVDLHLKASSVLLHEEFLLKADVAGSTDSKRLKTYGSSSTINSYYDAYQAPLAVSQQTSESSRRDFALRKGAPVVVKSMTPDKDSLRQLKLFRLTKSEDKPGTKKPTKQSPQPGDPTVTMLFGGQRPARPSDQTGTTRLLHHNHHSKTQKGVRFQSLNAERTKSSGISASRQETPYVKVNIRRPKAGAKHWFDGLEGDSSDDESVHEPELQPSFVAGMEMAFEGGRIGLIPKEGARITTHTSETSSRGTSSRAPSSHLLPSSAVPARVSTLNAKSSRSTLSRSESQQTLSKPKASSLASTDLHKTSILDLSSSDDEQPQLPAQSRESVKAPLPLLRDSIAVESLAESEIEIGTAKAVSTKHNASVKATPSLRRVYGTHPRRPSSSMSKTSHTRRNHRSTYLSDISSNPPPEDDDLLTSFPATPSDQASSHRPSFHESCLSDTASIESRRLMSVTRQEESLLAAIRSRKAALGQSSGGATDRRIQLLRDVEKKSTMQQRPPRTSAAVEVQLAFQGRTHKQAQSLSSDANFDQASCTTFQTGLSTEPSGRYSLASFRTGTSIEPETEISSSLATFSPGLLAPSNRGANRMSRSTFFSTSTNSSRDNSRNRRESHYLATLEKLQAAPKREEVSSQDFIDFPYNGWMKLAATAH